MRSAVAALLLAEAALSGSLVTAQPYNERRTCLVPDGPGHVNQHIDLYEVVATAEHLQLAVGRGTRFIFLINDVDMRTLPVATTDPNCGVLKATTTSVIQVGHDHSSHVSPSLHLFVSRSFDGGGAVTSTSLAPGAP